MTIVIRILCTLCFVLSSLFAIPGASEIRGAKYKELITKTKHKVQSTPLRGSLPMSFYAC